MKRISVDFEFAQVTVDDGRETIRLPLASAEAFRAVSHAWLRAGWDAKYVYSFSWLGRPIIQLPDDMFRIQEIIYDVQPDIVLETGIAHGGSLVFYAGLCRTMNRGRVIGVDIDIRAKNRFAIEQHFLKPYITLIEGSSTATATLDRVRCEIRPDDRVLVVLDSGHSLDHVLSELKLYSEFVSPGSYIVATDGIMADLVGAPRSKPDWSWNNPKEAVRRFLRERGDFEAVEPAFPFNEGIVDARVTYWPNCYLRRRR